MHLHGSGISHGSITSVGKMEDLVNPHTDDQSVQNNILITKDGQACLGDFGTAWACIFYPPRYYQPETLRCMAPEHFIAQGDTFLVEVPSQKGDVYSLAMTSFSVCASFGNRPTT